MFARHRVSGFALAPMYKIGEGVKKEFAEHHEDRCAPALGDSNTHRANRPASPYKLPMLMNVAKSCPPGWGGSCLDRASSAAAAEAAVATTSQQVQKSAKLDGLKLIASAFRAHEIIAMKRNAKRGAAAAGGGGDAEGEGDASPPPILYHDDHCMLVQDAFPKSTFHFLVMPRLAAPNNRDGGMMAVADVTRQEQLAVLRRMDGICAEVVKAIFAAPLEVECDDDLLRRMLRSVPRSAATAGRANDKNKSNIDVDVDADADAGADEAEHGDAGRLRCLSLREWLLRPRSHRSRALPVNRLRFMSGFHSLPSLCPLHMHLTSLDMTSDSLKHKKHYNSFTTGFFLSRSFVDEQVRKHGVVKQVVGVEGVASCEAFETQAMICVWCQAPLRSVPELKEHLVKCKNNECYFVQQAAGGKAGALGR